MGKNDSNRMDFGVTGFDEELIVMLGLSSGSILKAAFGWLLASVISLPALSECPL